LADSSLPLPSNVPSHRIRAVFGNALNATFIEFKAEAAS
jgi:hypothetical protein